MADKTRTFLFWCFPVFFVGGFVAAATGGYHEYGWWQVPAVGLVIGVGCWLAWVVFVWTLVGAVWGEGRGTSGYVGYTESGNNPDRPYGML